MKHLLLFILLSSGIVAGAQSRFPYDTTTREVIYSQLLRFNPKVKPDDVYAAALTWFNDPGKFTRKNADPPVDSVKAKKNKKKIEAEAQFANPRPLQMQDPAGGKIQGMGIIRYYSTGNSIKLLYIKYDINIKVQPTNVTISVSNIHYFHYNATSYKQVPLYNFSGGKPCEEVGTLESLVGCEKFEDEFKDLALYCNKVIYGQMSDFGNLLRQKRYIYDGKVAPATAPKALVKTAAKSPPPMPAPKKKP